MPWLSYRGTSRAAERRLLELDERRKRQHAAAVERRRKAKRGGKR